MARRVMSESGYYHICVKSAGQIALFEDDGDRRYFLRLLKEASEKHGATIIAWVLMSDHVHLIAEFYPDTTAITPFMYYLDKRYAVYFNRKTGRSGGLQKAAYWSKPIENDAQLIATTYYLHMNPERAGIADMRSYHWSSYQEYAGKHWVVDTSVILDLFGSFDAFDAYQGSDADVVRRNLYRSVHDRDVLSHAMRITGASTSGELRKLPVEKRNESIVRLRRTGATVKQIARTFGIGTATVSRILRA